MHRAKRDVKEKGYWWKKIREAVGRGLSIREFCWRRELEENQSHW